MVWACSILSNSHLTTGRLCNVVKIVRRPLQPHLDKVPDFAVYYAKTAMYREQNRKHLPELVLELMTLWGAALICYLYLRPRTHGKMTIMMDMRMVGGGENFPEALVNRVWSLPRECTQSSISNKFHVKMEANFTIIQPARKARGPEGPARWER